MNAEKLKDLFYSKCKQDQIELIYDSVRNLRGAHRQRERAIETYSSFSGPRTGQRGGRLTSLLSKADQATKHYEEMVDQLKTLVDLLQK